MTRQIQTVFGIGATVVDDDLKFTEGGRGNRLDEVAVAGMVRDDRDALPYQLERTPEPELPVAVRINSFDHMRDYQPVTALAKRIQEPVATMRATTVEDHDLASSEPLINTKHLAERVLYTRWASRYEVGFKVPASYLEAVPGDVAEVTLDDVKFARARVSEASVGANWEVELEMRSEGVPTAVDSDAGDADGRYLYTDSDLGGDDGSNFETRRPKGEISLTDLHLLDIPYVADTVALPFDSPTVAWGASPTNPYLTWGGARLFSSSDEVNWEPVDAAEASMVTGELATELPAPASPWRIVEQSFQVNLVSGDLESITELAMLNGGNRAAIVSDSGTEIIQFQNAVLQDDGSYLLSRLIRGRRGTEPFSGAYEVGTTFVLLRDIRYIRVLREELNNTRYYRAPTIGNLLESTFSRPFAAQGANLRPWAVAHLQAATGAGGDVVLTWVRRPRINGALTDGTGTVPVAEESEKYEVDVIDPVQVVTRTLEVTEPTATYAASDRVEDGIGRVDVTFRVYQISAVTGRGLVSEVVASGQGGVFSPSTTRFVIPQISGTLMGTDDIDHTFTLTEETVVAALIYGLDGDSSLDFSLQMWEQGGVSAIASRTRDNDTPTMITSTLQAGNYLIRVKGTSAGNTSAYVLDIVAAEPEPLAEGEAFSFPGHIQDQNLYVFFISIDQDAEVFFRWFRKSGSSSSGTSMLIGAAGQRAVFDINTTSSFAIERLTAGDYMIYMFGTENTDNEFSLIVTRPVFSPLTMGTPHVFADIEIISGQPRDSYYFSIDAGADVNVRISDPREARNASDVGVSLYRADTGSLERSLRFVLGVGNFTETLTPGNYAVVVWPGTSGIDTAVTLTITRNT